MNTKHLELFKLIRNQSGLPVWECKEIVEQAAGYYDQAVVLLRLRGIRTFKEGTVTNEGRIFAELSPDRKVGCMVELLCQTDFAAKSEVFDLLGMRVCNELLRKTDKATFEERLGGYIGFAVQKLGEKIVLGRYNIFEL